MARQSRRSVLKAAGTTVAAASVAGCLGESGTSLSYGGGAEGSSTFNVGQALQRIVSENSDIDMSVQITGGGEANLRQYGQGQLDLLGAINFGYIQAANDQGSWADQPLDRVPLQGFTYSWFDMYFAKRPGLDIETMEDVSGLTIWPFPTGTSLRQGTELVLDELGLLDEVELSDVSPTDIPGALEEGRLDVFSSYGVSGLDLAPAVKQIDAQTEVELVPFSESQNETLRELELLEFFESDPYGWEQDVGVDTITGYSAPSQVAFGEDMADDTVYEIASIAHENASSLRESAPEAPDLSDPAALTNAVVDGIPVHPGAEEFYREIGAWDDSWTSA